MLTLLSLALSDDDEVVEVVVAAVSGVLVGDVQNEGERLELLWG